jgi:hypothetical protein
MSSDKQLDTLNILLESVEKEYKDEDTEDVVDKDEGIGGGESGECGQSEEKEMEEGAIGNLATKVAKAVAGGAKDVLAAAAKGTVEGILGPKEERLLDVATKNYAELLRVSGINVTDETTKKLLDQILARNIVKYVEKKRGQEKKAQAAPPKKGDFEVVK